MGVKERKEESLWTRRRIKERVWELKKESVWTRRRIKESVWELKKGRKKVYEREEEWKKECGS